MNRYIIIFVVLLFPFASKGQTSDVKIEKNYIEVMGEAEMQIIPDEIYINITIRERYEGRVKITIDSIEQQLKITLKELSIDIKNLTLADASSDYIRVRWAKKDVLTSKYYTLKVSTASQVSNVFEALSKIKIQELDIYKVDHSKIEDFKKEVKINAIKSAKEKAGYLLESIGQQVGKPIRIVEEDIPIDDYADNAMFRTGSGYGVSVGSGAGARSLREEQRLSDEISFSKIKVEYKIRARFEIK